MGPVAPRHVGSSQTRAQTRVPCIGRQILNHCATREAPKPSFYQAAFFFNQVTPWAHAQNLFTPLSPSCLPPMLPAAECRCCHLGVDIYLHTLATAASPPPRSSLTPVHFTAEDLLAPPLLCSPTHNGLLFFFFFSIIYLAVLGLICDKQDLRCRVQGLQLQLVGSF